MLGDSDCVLLMWLLDDDFEKWSEVTRSCCDDSHGNGSFSVFLNLDRRQDLRRNSYIIPLTFGYLFGFFTG